MAGIVTHFSCLHLHSPHFPPFFLGHVAQYPPHSPPGPRKMVFGGFWCNTAPIFPQKICKFSQ